MEKLLEQFKIFNSDEKAKFIAKLIKQSDINKVSREIGRLF